MDIPALLLATLLFTLKSFLFLTCVIFILFAIIVILLHRRISTAPPHIPWVGLRNRTFLPKIRACLGELSAGRSMVDEGWEKYGSKNLPFIIPGMNWPGIVLPPSNIGWLARQPESVLSGDKVLDDTFGLDYLMHGPSATSCLDFSVIRRDLTRQTLTLTPDILDEITASLEDELSMLEGSAWKDVKLGQVISELSFRTANRVFVGLPQCRNKAYGKAVSWWTSALGISVVMLRWVVPTGGRRIVAPIFGMWTRLTERWVVRDVVKDVRQRLMELNSKTMSSEKDSVAMENDMTQWIINDNSKKADARDMKPESIAGKMLLFNLFATGTTQLVLETLLLKLLAHGDAASILDELREEADRIMPLVLEDARAARDMSKLDSAIRETLRCYPLGGQGMFREVITPGGVETPDGLYLPQGSHVQAVVSTMQQHAAPGEEPAAQYDPLRCWKSAKGNDDCLEVKRMLAVQVSEDFLAFGLGKHACPGRFFAVHVIKLVVGYLLSHFEFEPLTEEAKFTTIGEALVPSSKNVIKMRRRQVNAHEG